MQEDWIEFDSAIIIGTIHLWDTEFLDCLIYRKENGNEIVNSHFELKESQQVIELVNNL